jgi:predicted outer membrane repeat protein
LSFIYQRYIVGLCLITKIGKMSRLQIVILSLVLLHLNVNARIIYVKTDAKGANNGVSWNAAFTDIQKAIQKANSGDEIWVAKGTYYPTSGNDKSATFRLKENVSVYGGFAGTETNIAQRNWETNPTILSGNIGDKTINTDNCAHVVTTANNALIDGFIVEDGYAMGDAQSAGGKMQQTVQRQGSGQAQTHTSPQNIMQSANDHSGGGILNFKTCATVRNTTIRNCYAGKGGGVYNMTNTSDRPNGLSPSPVFINVKFQSNYAMMRGGGMENDMGTNPVLVNCEFTDNECGAKGGALYNDFGCSPIIMACLFENNKAHDAAALGNDGSSSPIIIDTKIVNNTVESQGAGLYQGSYNANLSGQGNSPLVINSIIKNNKSTTNGLHNVVNWGEDWIYAWNSEIEGFNQNLDKLDEKYIGLIEISEQIKSLDAEKIDQLYAEKILAYINSNSSKSTKGGGSRGFGTDNELSKTASIPQHVVYVKSGSKNGDGQSWKTAFNSLQDAINSAYSDGGGEVWLAVGVYKPTSNKNRDASFILKNGVAVYGGFSGIELNKTERDYKKNKTILSGNIGDENSAEDNSYHVVKGCVNSIIDGVTISDGYANGNITNRYGGGLFNWGYESSSIVQNTVFTNNYAEDGGAVFCFKDVLSYFENVRFENNKALIGGAASFRFGSSCELNNCTFSNNTATSRAGAMAINYGSNVILNHSTFTKNSTDGNGGAIWVDDQASQYGGTKPLITDCVFSNNKAQFYGGAIENYNIATSLIQSCSFQNNEAKFGNDIANNLRSQVTVSDNKNPDTDIFNDETSFVSTSANEKRRTSSAKSKTLDDLEFSVTIIGSSSPVYNPERSQPSALVQYKGVKFLVDMGNGTQTQLQKLGLTGKNSPDVLLLTHHHIDHNDEFISMLHSKFMMRNEFLVAGPAPIDEMTKYAAKFYAEDLNYRMSSRGKTFDENNTNAVVKVLNGGESFEYKGVKISTLEVPHSIKTIAYRFDAGGQSIVITGDLMYTSNLQSLAKDADIMVIDGKTVSNGNNGTRQKTNTNSGSAHASIEELAKMAVESNPKTMVLTHLGTQPADADATSKGYAGLGYQGKVVIAADFLTITPDGDTFMLEEQSSSNLTRQKNTQNVSSGNARGNNQQRNSSLNSGQQGSAMTRLDANGDNKISQTEAKGPLKENFSQIDKNGDGFITEDELANRQQKR